MTEAIIKEVAAKFLSTFPKHFHCESDAKVVESNLSAVHELAVR